MLPRATRRSTSATSATPVPASVSPLPPWLCPRGCGFLRSLGADLLLHRNRRGGGYSRLQRERQLQIDLRLGAFNRSIDRPFGAPGRVSGGYSNLKKTRWLWLI